MDVDEKGRGVDQTDEMTHGSGLVGTSRERRNRLPFFIRAIADNVSHVCDVALSPTRAKGHVAERRAAAPRSPRRLLRRRCIYALL
jgi:hypothetical protein